MFKIAQILDNEFYHLYNTKTKRNMTNKVLSKIFTNS